MIDYDRQYHFTFLKWRRFDVLTAFFAMIGLFFAILNFEFDVEKDGMYFDEEFI